MTRLGIPQGGAIPSGWSSQTARQLAEASQGFDRILGEIESVDLVQEMFDSVEHATGAKAVSSVWPVPDQGARNTCTAFAVKAAEELWRFLHEQEMFENKPIPLSAEFLYSKMRDHSFEKVGVVPDDRLEALDRAGATFLLQARKGLAVSGVCPEKEAPYSRAQLPAYRQKNFTRQAEAAASKVAEDEFIHDIVDISENGGAVVGVNKIWRNRELGADTTTSAIFINALQGRSPVIAAFALLGGVGKTAWVGARSRLCGKIVYPEDGRLGASQPTGGHTVCITGYETDAAGDLWFIFRNSFGPFDFAWEAENKLRCGPIPREKGYGVISADNVDRYCWEFMFRNP